jgi:death on curing protein
VRYLTFEEITQAHQKLLNQYGGSAGIRDRGLLDSAIHRPQAVVFGEDAYPKIHDKAAAICHSLIFNHPFVDGNKRIAFAACHLTLLFNGWELTATSEEIYPFLIEAIKTHLDWKEISDWLKQHSKKSR